ncbi:unnamed protein product [Caenorhabditis nigoni]
MPVRLLSFPFYEIQYVLECMDFCDITAFSLCSNRTKRFVKSLNRKAEAMFAETYENGIRLDIRPWKNEESQNLIFYLDFCNRLVKFEREKGKENWRKPKFTLGDWMAHFLSIFKKSMVDELEIHDVCPEYFLDIVKQVIQKCGTLKIRPDCPIDLTNLAFFKLAPISEKVEIRNNEFDDENDIFQLLSLNLKSASFTDWGNPFKLTSGDLMSLNIEVLLIGRANLSEKELNRFLKMWMKNNHRFDRKKQITLYSNVSYKKNHVFKGIEFEIVQGYYSLKRKDGKELRVLMDASFIEINFS